MTGHDSTPAPERFQNEVTAGRGGAMTDEVGVVTGDLVIATTALPGRRAAVAVQYTGAAEWYTLTGSPVPLPPGGLAALHADVLERVRQGGAAEALH
jgi:hypothetical protein